MPQLVKNLHAVWETWVQTLGWEDPLEKGTPTHCSFLAWRIPWTWGHKESDTTEQLSLLPNLCQSNETSFWFQTTCRDLYIQMNAAHAKSRFNIFVFFPNDAVITLNILEFVCENCFHNLNNSRFRKYLSSICPVHYTKILHSIFGLKKEQFLFLMRLQNRTNIYILPKFSSVEQYISAIIKI